MTRPLIEYSSCSKFVVGLSFSADDPGIKVQTQLDQVVMLTHQLTG